MIKYKQLLENIQNLIQLDEGRVDFIKNNTKEISTEHDQNAEHSDKDKIIDHLSDKADPTKNKSHTQWLVNQYKKGNIRQEDHPQLKDTLSDFEKYKGKLEKKDINQYKDIGEVRGAVNPHVGLPATKKEESESGHRLVHEEPGLKVYHVASEEASKNIYGGGSKLGGHHTDWCTAARSVGNQFENYNKSGKLYTFHKENDPKSPYQMHLSHEGDNHQFQDKTNNSANLTSDIIKHHPEVKNIKEFSNSNNPELHHSEHQIKRVSEISSKENPTDGEKSYKSKVLSKTDNKELLDTHLNDSSTHNNPNLSKEQQEKIYNTHGAKSLEYNKGLHPDMIDKVGLRPSYHEKATKNNLLHHIENNSLSGYSAKEIENHPAADHEVINKLYDKTDERTKRVLLANKHISDDKTESNIEHPVKAGILASNPGLSIEHYRKLHDYANKNDFEHIHTNLSANKSVPSDVHKDLIDKYTGKNSEIVKNSSKNLKGKK